MSTKHKPATPLPWTVSKDGYNVWHGPQLITPNEYRREKYKHDVKNAAYIAHAANSYPRLVEALRTIAKPALGGKQQQYAAQAILRELGEE